MVSCLAELGKTYVEKLINRVTAELRFVFCFTCIAKEFEEIKPELEAERKTMEQRVQVAVSEGKVIRANVLHWIKKVDKLIQGNTKTKQTCFFGFCPDCIGRYKRGKELVNMTEEIKSSIEKGEIFEIIDLPQSLPGCGYYSLDYYIQFKGRESKYKELLDVLKDDNNYMTGLQGMGGTGKTTLAIKVGKELEESKQFDHVIDTTVSFTLDIKKIQDDIAGPLGLKLKDCNNSDRPKILRSRLTNGEKILLILDDVWDQDTPLDFDRIGIPKQDNHNGCRVLITTRSKRILDTMNCDKKIELEILSDEDAWIMFKKYAGINDSFSNSLTSKGQKIARECKGLPVAIAVIARSLKGQQHRKHEWDATLKSLKKHVSMPNVDDDVVGIYKCLKFSYDYMKNKKAKELLLLSSVFPEDEIISVEILTRLGIGMGLFGEDYRSYNDTRNEVVVAKNKLIDSCLLLDVIDTENKENVKMHDLVHDAAQWIANKEIWDVNLSIKDQKLLVQKEINIKYLFCKGKGMDLFSCKFECSKLETLIFDIDSEGQECMEVPNSFFENIFKLRVLYFKSTDKVHSLSLPQSIQSLTNIRSLLVEGVDLGDISILGKLPSLETLDLDFCAINELPFEITKLGKFKLLNLDNCVIRRNNPFEVIEKCSSLEELYFKKSFNNFCQEITIPELQKYHIHKGWSRTKYSQSKYVNFCASDASFFSEKTLNYFMRTTEFLQLLEIERGWRNLMPEIVPIDLGMNDLVELHLISISQLQCLIKTIGSQVPNVLSKLVVLRLDMMENLEELFNGSLSFDSLKNLERLSMMECKKFQRFFNCKLNLSNLKTLILEQCPMLVSLFQLMSQNLVQLEKLEITDCEELKNIIDVKREEESREEIDDGDNDNKRHGSIFPKLKVLDIERCHRLESIIPFLSSQDFPVLEAISIKRCDGLKYIFSQYQHVELKSLKQMELFQLPSFIDIFPKCYDSMSLLVNESCSTSRDGFKAQIQLDPIKCNIFSWTYICCRGDKFGSSSTTRIPLVSEDQPQEYSITSVSNSHNLHIWERAQCLSVHPHFMCNIKNIVLFQILKIKSVFILSIAPRMLETLTITNCDELKHIVIDTEDHDSSGNNWGNVFPTLKRLHVQKCMQLEYIFGHYTNDHQNHTEIHLHLSALQYLNFCNLPSLVAMCPKKYRPTFPSLKELELKNCSQVDIKSIGDFIIHSVSKSQDSTIMKELSVKHFIPLESLRVDNSKAENLFCLNEMDGQPMNLGLQKIQLSDMHDMKYLFGGPKNSFVLKNLTKIIIIRCEILEVLFSTSILRCLSKLVFLRIEECKELKHIIEDDLQNQNMLNSFPKLKVLVVVKCCKLKYVLPVSICKEFLELEALVIRKALELEEIFKSEGDHKVKIPKLNFIVFDKLPSLFFTQGIQFQTTKNRFVRNCRKLSSCLASTPYSFVEIYNFFVRNTDRETYKNVFQQLQEESDGSDSGNESPSAETTEDFDGGIEVEAASQIQMKLTPEAEHEFVENVPDLEIPSIAILPTNSKELVNEQSTNQQCLINQQHPLGEFDTTAKPSQGNNCVEEGTSLTNANTITPSIHLELVSSSKEQHVDVRDSVETTKTNDDQVSLNDDVVVKVTSTIEEQFHTPSMPFEGNPSQIVEDINSPSIVTWELEELVSKKHLDYQNLSLLTDFLVKHPSCLLRDTSLSNRYKGYAYHCLAELLKFLQTRSVLDVLGSSHSVFVELIQDARRFAFDKNWLDGVEKRALFPDLQFSQDAFQKLLDSKKHVTKDVEDMLWKIDVLAKQMDVFNHQLTSSEAVLQSIIQQETQVLETKAALSAPLGY
uniref:Uncharacterized protein LOC101504174 isoform X2 n=1 Tax=Cicer arietinum TaxID=3827 RepID=A0A3Q7YFJ1_CICAR|nr:uncharacterized protein LOC101504174 isoform X2 [Cicer arietinum]